MQINLQCDTKEMIYLTMWSNAVAWKKYRIYASVGKLHISSCRSGVWFKILIYSLGFTGDWEEKTKYRDGTVDGHRFSCTARRSYRPRQRAVLMDAVANETKLYRGIVRRVWQTRKGRGEKKALLLRWSARPSGCRAKNNVVIGLQSMEKGQATEATPMPVPREWHVIVYTEFTRYVATL